MEILKFKIDEYGSAYALSIEPNLQPLAWLITSAVHSSSDIKDFYERLEKVQSSPDPNAIEQWGLNADSYIIRKNNIGIITDYPTPQQEVLTVPIPLFLQALHEWEEFLKEHCPKYAG